MGFVGMEYLTAFGNLLVIDSCKLTMLVFLYKTYTRRRIPKLPKYIDGYWSTIVVLNSNMDCKRRL